MSDLVITIPGWVFDALITGAGWYVCIGLLLAPWSMFVGLLMGNQHYQTGGFVHKRSVESLVLMIAFWPVGIWVDYGLFDRELGRE